MGAAAAALRTVDPRVQAGLEAALRELGARIIGADAPRLPNTTCAAFPGLDAADLVMALDLEGVATSSGAACASGSPEPSHVLRAMGIPGSALRFSTGPDTTTDEVWEALDRLRVILDRCR
jgi:cysteine desulfurase